MLATKKRKKNILATKKRKKNMLATKKRNKSKLILAEPMLAVKKEEEVRAHMLAVKRERS